MSAGCVRGYRRSCFPSRETAARTERRAAPHHRLCVSHPHTVSDTTQHQPLAASASHGQEDQEHIFIQASIPQLPTAACAPPTPGAFIHPLASFFFIYLKTKQNKKIFASARIYFPRCICILRDGFNVLIASCEAKKPPNTDSGTRSIIVTAQLSPHRAGNLRRPSGDAGRELKYSRGCLSRGDRYPSESCSQDNFLPGFRCPVAACSPGPPALRSIEALKPSGSPLADAPLTQRG